MQILTSIVWFVVAIGVLVTVHEFGHFIVARRLGVCVLRFSVGFGKPLWRWQKGPDTVEYCIGSVPLGGYVKMLDESEGPVAPERLSGAFNRQSLAVRTAVVLAGPLFNFLFAIVAYWAVFVLGVGGLKPVIGVVEPGSPAAAAGLRAGEEIVAVGERETRTWQGVIESVIGATLEGGALAVRTRDAGGGVAELALDMSGIALDDLTQGKLFERLGLEPRRRRMDPVLGEVRPGSPAAAAGLRVGDRLLAADGTDLPGWQAFVTHVRARPGVAVDLLLERAGERLSLRVVPAVEQGPEGPFGRIGAAVAPPGPAPADYYATERYGPLESLPKALAKTWAMTALTLRMLAKMVTLEVSVKNLSGPISIAQYAGLSADVGLVRYLDFLAVVSISLGILNLLPIPLLDGGHLMYYCMEFIRGRPVSDDVLFIGQRLGIAVLFGLMGLAFYNDLARIFG